MLVVILVVIAVFLIDTIFVAGSAWGIARYQKSLEDEENDLQYKLSCVRFLWKKISR